MASIVTKPNTPPATTAGLVPFVDARTARLQRRLKEENLDAFITFSPANRRYLTGFDGSFGFALVDAAGDRTFFTDWRYDEQAAAQAPSYSVVRLQKNKDLLTPLAARLAELGVNRLGFESDHVTPAWLADAAAGVTGVEWVPLRRFVEGLRAVKDEYEVARLAEAQALADEVWAHMLPKIAPGVTERQLAVELRHQFELAGAENYPGIPIVASGWRAALPHGRASNKELVRNEFVLFDFGALVNGYHSDMTRTVVLGKADEKMKEIYDLVLEAELAGLELAQRPGVTGRDIDRACRVPIHRGGYQQYEHGFSVGHGLGLEVHEDPFVSEAYEARLEPGMVITVEPGIYVPGFTGVRIEDTVLITEGGGEVLNSSPRDLLEL